MSKHTPEPWTYEYDNDTGPSDDYYVEFYKITGASGYVGQCDTEDDARLASAAPDLLEALEDARNKMVSQLIILRCDDRFIKKETEKADKAIAKARGEA